MSIGIKSPDGARASGGGTRDSAREATNRLALCVKRITDVVLAVGLLICSSPAAAVIVCAILLDSGRGVLFRQVRSGRDGKPFQVFKFRTMVFDAENMTADLMTLSQEADWLKLDSDPRVTRVGRWLRHTSLDELPQLLNVLRGEMSLVGPRPLVPSEAARVGSRHRARMEVKPGMTGLWQVSGRTDLSFSQMLALDCAYVRNWSLREDLRLLLATVPAVLCRRGAN